MSRAQDTSATLAAASGRLRDTVAGLRRTGWPRVAVVYDPLTYAWEPHVRYLERYGRKSPRRLVLVGMNPGPWGMGQTGVPFGDPVLVRDWMGIGGAVDQPDVVHPRRPVRGFSSTRREGSGQRLYGWAKDRWKTAERFFDDVFVTNYCPLMLLGENGENLTPADLPRRDMAALFEACDAALAEVLEALAPDVVVGVGNFARQRVEKVVGERKLPCRVGGIMHPSPANPHANRNWAETVETELERLGVAIPGRS